MRDTSCEGIFRFSTLSSSLLSPLASSSPKACERFAHEVQSRTVSIPTLLTPSPSSNFQTYSPGTPNDSPSYPTLPSPSPPPPRSPPFYPHSIPNTSPHPVPSLESTRPSSPPPRANRTRPIPRSKGCSTTTRRGWGRNPPWNPGGEGLCSPIRLLPTIPVRRLRRAFRGLWN